MRVKIPKTKTQARRVVSKMRARTQEARRCGAPTVGDLIAAAFDALEGSPDVVRVLGSFRMARRIGRRLVFV